MLGLWIFIVALPILVFADLPGRWKLVVLVLGALGFGKVAIRLVRRHHAARVRLRGWLDGQRLAERGYRLRNARSDLNGQPSLAVAPDRKAVIAFLPPDGASPEIVADRVIGVVVRYWTERDTVSIMGLDVALDDGTTVSLGPDNARAVHDQLKSFRPGTPSTWV